MTKRICLASTSLIVVLVVSVLVAQPKAPPIPQKDFTGKTAYRVVGITDGDTLTLAMDEKTGETKIRLLGVDAPELKEPGGREAQRFLDNLLKGEFVYVDADKLDEKDLYGRTLAYLYRAPDGLFVNLEVVRQGYGHVYTKAKCKQHELLAANESIAKDAKKGVWSPATEAPAEPQQPKVQARTGDQEKQKQEITVYVTRTGKKYHRAGCSYLKSAIPMALSAAKAQGYSPCSRCNPPT